MHILIAGGSGLIGLALTNRLIHNHHQVVILSRNPSQVHGLPPGAQVIRWDGLTPNGWGNMVNHVDAIINLSGNKIAGENLWQILFQKWDQPHKLKIINSRLGPGTAILQAVKAARHKPAVLLQASAVGFYGDRGDRILDENAPPGNDFVSHFCQEWEASTREVEALGLRHVVMRIGLVLSLQGGFLPVMLLPIRFFIGGRMGTGDQFISWVHFHDTIEAICYLTKKNDSKGVYNLTAPSPVSNAAFNHVAATILRRPAVFPIPGWMLKFVMGEKAGLVLHGQRVVPTQLRQEGFKFKFTEIKPALQDLIRMK
jgi:uncharacterized protein (TIGR01777 family)